MKHLIFLLLPLCMGGVAFGQTVYGPKWGIGVSGGSVLTSNPNHPYEGPPGFNTIVSYPVHLSEWPIASRITWRMEAQRYFYPFNTKHIGLQLGINFSSVPGYVKTVRYDKYTGATPPRFAAYRVPVYGLHAGLTYGFNDIAKGAYVHLAMGLGYGWTNVSHQTVFSPSLTFGVPFARTFTAALQWQQHYNKDWGSLGMLNLTVGWQFGRKQIYPRRTNRWWGGPGWK